MYSTSQTTMDFNVLSGSTTSPNVAVSRYTETLLLMASCLLLTHNRLLWGMKNPSRKKIGRILGRGNKGSLAAMGPSSQQ